MGVISGKTQLLGVMGYPVEHSLSPLMHNAALQAMAELRWAQAGRRPSQLSLPYVYLPLAIAPDQLATAVAGLMALGWVGFNVTIPHKQAIMPLLQEVTPLAEAVGAVNTVWRTSQGWAGTNTDVQGFLAPLLAQQREGSAMTVTLLGCGGAARAVVAGCAQWGCDRVCVIGRDRTKLTQFQASFAAGPLPIAVTVDTWEHLWDHLPHTTLLVNTTPVGLSPHINATPLTDAQVEMLPSTAWVYDLIYTPDPTRLMQQAQARGLATQGGLEMLVQQGAAALEIWLGEGPAIATMRQAAQDFLKTSEKNF